MENYESITASGTGFWHKAYQVNLVNFTKVYTSRINHQKREIIEYGFYFTEREGLRPDKRTFSTENERSLFLAKNFNDLNLVPMQNPAPVRVQYYLDGLNGEELSSITFVMDYLQIHFNEHGFNFYIWPIIHDAQVIYHQQDIEYRNGLCDLIGKKIIKVDEYLDWGLCFEFENGVILRVPLKVNDQFPGPEIAEFRDPNNEWRIWQVGEPPFE